MLKINQNSENEQPSDANPAEPERKQPESAATSSVATSTEPAPPENPENCVTKDLDHRRLLLVISGCLIALSVIALFTTLYFGQVIFFPIVLAFVLKLIFSPVVRKAGKFRIPEPLTAALIVGGILALCTAAIVFLAGPASVWMESVPSHMRTVAFKLRSIKEPIEKVSAAGARVDELTKMEAEEEGKVQPIPVQVNEPGVLSSVVNTTGDFLMGAFLTLVLLFFLLAGGDRLLEKAISLTPDWRNKRNLVSLARDVQQSLSSYLFATTCINIVLGILIGVGMWLVGLPNPILWGVMAAALNYIPYFGAIVGGAIVFAVGLVQLETVTDALYAPIIYYGLNALEGYFVTPAILGRSISLSPLAIVISMVVWGFVWGVGGVLLSVPILAATKIACDHTQRLQPVGQLLGR